MNVKRNTHCKDVSYLDERICVQFEAMTTSKPQGTTDNNDTTFSRDSTTNCIYIPTIILLCVEDPRRCRFLSKLLLPLTKLILFLPRGSKTPTGLIFSSSSLLKEVDLPILGDVQLQAWLSLPCVAPSSWSQMLRGYKLDCFSRA